MAKYRILPDRSQLWAEARSNVHPIRIQTPGFEGTVEAETADRALQLSPRPAAQIRISADLMKSGIELYDNEIRRMIEIRKFPDIKGELIEVEALGAGNYRLRGRLSFHGVTKDVDGKVQVRLPDENTIEVEGEQIFDMREFNLEPPKILMLRVLPEISVRARVTAVREEG